MKNLLSALSLCAITCTAVAQPTLTISDLQTASGNQITNAVTNYMEAGPAGADQTWDFSDLPVLQNMEFTHLTASETEYFSMFPGSNIASVMDDGSQVGYSSYSENGIEIMGLVQNGVVMDFPDPRTQVQLPITYNSTYTDTYVREAELAPGIENIESGTIDVVVDGYGTLILPNATYTNVLRLKHTNNGVLEGLIDGEVFSSDPFTDVTYTWITSGVPIALLSFVNFQTEFNTSTTATMYVSGVLGIEDEILSNNVRVFPNPAVDQVNIEISVEESLDTEVYLFSLDGRQVQDRKNLQLVPGFNRTTIDVQGLSAGVYVIKIQSADQSIERKLTVY